MEIPIPKLTEKDIYDFGFDSLLNRTKISENSVVYNSNEQIQPVQLSGSGVVLSDLTLGSGNIKSANYKQGSEGWKLSSEGNLEANSGIFRGVLTGNTINIPNTINPKFIVESDGKMTAKEFNLVTQYTAGENLVAGRVVCFRHKQAAWGNEPSADRETTAIIQAMTYVDSGYPNTNYSSSDDINLPYLGVVQNSTRYIYGKIDLVNSPPTLPSWNEVEDVRLRIYIVFTTVNVSNRYVWLSRLTGSFSESTITWNNKPADDGVEWATGQICNPYLDETTASSANLQQTGYIEFDITELYRLWSAGKLTNYGFVLKTNLSVGEGYVRIGGRTRQASQTFKQAPYILFTPVNNGTTGIPNVTINDGKVYYANYEDYRFIKQIAGITKTSANAGGVVDVYTLVDRSIIPYSSPSIGRLYYLSGTQGQINYFTNDIIPHDKWALRIGVGVSNGIMVDFEKNPIFIKVVKYPNTGILPPPHARMAVIKYTNYKNYGGGIYGTWRGEIILFKDRIQSISNVNTYLEGTYVGRGVSASWASGTSGLLTINFTDPPINDEPTYIYWYK